MPMKVPKSKRQPQKFYTEAAFEEAKANAYIQGSVERGQSEQRAQDMQRLGRLKMMVMNCQLANDDVVTGARTFPGGQAFFVISIDDLKFLASKASGL